MKLRVRLFAGALAALLAACAGEGPRDAASSEASSSLFTSFPVAGATPAVQAPAALAALQAELTRRLQADTRGATQNLVRSADGALRIAWDADAVFEADTAQMRAETLLLLVDCASVARGAYVVHVLGHADAVSGIEAAGLAERRATSVASYLISQGLPASRVRAEGRMARRPLAQKSQIELVFAPIIEGREGRAWMPPT